MTGVRALVIGLIGASAFVAGAQAADMPRRDLPPAPEYKDYEPQYRELLSGWYLRADFGYRWNSIGSIDGASAVTGKNIPNTPAVTAGFGYKYQWFRADLTVDRGLTTKVTGTTATATAQPQYTAKITSLSTLANAYVDFGTWSGFTPYVGGGLGVTKLRSVGYNDTATFNGNVGTPAGSRVNFSWAWMAGVAFKVSPTWLVDVGFRHIDMGRVENTMGTNLVTDRTTFNKLSADEVRIGIRYLFD